MRKKHSLKIWPRFYDPVDLGLKTFEVRKNDRDYRAGDLVIMREWDPEAGAYTDKPELGPYVIGYVLALGGANYGYVAFSLLPVDALGLALLTIEREEPEESMATTFARTMGVDLGTPGGDKTAVIHGEMRDGELYIDSIETQEALGG